jgi:TolB-like protein
MTTFTITALLSEARRRRVFRVAALYVVGAWITLQAADLAFPGLGIPESAIRYVWMGAILGLPVALLFGWRYDIRGGRIVRTMARNIDTDLSIRRADYVILTALSAVVAMIAFELVGEISKTRIAETVPISITDIDPNSIAVLPFVNMSSDPEQEYFSDGMTEEILNLLAKIPDLKVIGRTSSFAFKGKNEDLREIGDALGVGHVLEGSVRRSGERLRITAQLIKVDDGFHLWSETYDREMADIFDIQDEVAGAITTALKIRLGTATERPTESAEAYALYVEALAIIDPADGDHRPAIALLDRAISYDPDFAKAYEAKALAYWNVSGWTLAADEAQVLVFAAARRAAELDSSLVAARSFRRTADPLTWSWVTEFDALDELIRLKPDDPSALGSFAFDLLTAGYFKEALDASRRHVELDPLSFSAHGNLYQSYIALGKMEQARKVADKLPGLGFPGWRPTLIAIEHVIAGEMDKAIAVAEDVVDISTYLPADFRLLVEGASDPENGREFLNEWIDTNIARATNFQEQTEPYLWLLYFGYLDEYWDAIRSIDPESSSSWSNAENLEHSGMIRHALGFTRHPQYLAYREKYRMTDVWDRRGAPDICSKADGVWVCE